MGLGSSENGVGEDGDGGVVVEVVEVMVVVVESEDGVGVDGGVGVVVVVVEVMVVVEVR